MWLAVGDLPKKYSMFHFTITASDRTARTGTFTTPHGAFETPCFMPCGTKGTVKSLDPQELTEIGCQVVLANAYHLMLRPGASIVKDNGGLHRWIGWNGPMLTDSGGYQVFSLDKIREITEQGVRFKWHVNGDQILLTPERSIEIQEELGADIIMAFDECAPHGIDEDKTRQAMERTHRWLERCLQAKKRTDQALFPIIQGGFYEALRTESAKFVTRLNPPGIAIGGVSVGETRAEMLQVVDWVTPLLPSEKPRYVMGVGEPLDLINLIERGIDIFDCVLPTRLARHGTFWTSKGRVHILRAEFRNSKEPLAPTCTCSTCTRFSTSYLRHLTQEKELLGYRLLTIHNLHFLLDLLKKIRAAIREGRYKEFADTFRKTYEQGEAIRRH